MKESVRLSFAPLTLADRERIKPLFLSVFTAAPWFDRWESAQLDAYLADLMGNPNSLPYGLLADGELAGASLGHLVHWCEGLEYFIDEFFIVPEKQGQGLGTRFLSAIEEAVREKGVHHLFLLTDRNTPACHFYRKAGMRVLETNVAFTKKLR